MPGDEIEVEYVEMVKGIEEEKRVAATVGPMDMFRGGFLFLFLERSKI